MSDSTRMNDGRQAADRDVSSGNVPDRKNRAAADWTVLEAMPEADALDQLHNMAGDLADNEKQTLAVVGRLAPEPFRLDVLAAALGLEVTALRPAVARLVQHGWLVEVEIGYQAPHALVHVFAGWLDLPDGTWEQLTTYYFQRLGAAKTAGSGIGAADRSHALAVLEGLVQDALWVLALGLAYPLAEYLDGHGHRSQRLAVYRLALQAAGSSHSYQAQSAWLTRLGLAYVDLGRVDEAIAAFERALVISRALDDRFLQGAQLSDLGNAYLALGRMQKAIDCYERSLAIQRELGDRRGQGNALANLGLVYTNLGQFEKAIDYDEQALAICLESGDRGLEAVALGNLGLANAGLGRLEAAIEYYEQALAIGEEMVDRRIQGNNLGNLGLANHQLGRVEEAVDYHERALAIGRQLADPQMQANNLGNLGLAYHGLGQFDLARKHMRQAVAIFEELGLAEAEVARAMLAEIEAGH